MNPQLVRNSLKLATAAFFTAAVASWCERVEFLWYPLMAVVIVVDDNDDQTLQAASARVLGTVVGGLVTFVVHTVLSGWSGVLVSMLILLPLLRLLGWQSAAGTAALLSVMFLMIPTHVALNWEYVVNRALDTVVGCLIAIGVGLLFWPRNGLQQLEQAEAGLRQALARQLQAYGRWVQQGEARPQPLPPAPLTESLLRMEQLVLQEQRGPRQGELRRRRWPQRLMLWQSAHHHWLQWERLMAHLPEGPPTGPGPIAASLQALADRLAGRPGVRPSQDPRPWQELAQRNRWPLLVLLSLAEEQRPLLSSLGGLGRLGQPPRTRASDQGRC
ncbi:FUSC family protein [Synechococcus sp. GreenBA-s]|nr:FUSC family protein [Synechococcus sp. GreenBA-s]